MRVIAIVFDALVLPKCLTDKDVALIITMESDNIGDFRLGREQLAGQILGVLELGHRRFGFATGRFDQRRLRGWRRIDLTYRPTPKAGLHPRTDSQKHGSHAVKTTKNRGR
jgi:hypothetical protein